METMRIESMDGCRGEPALIVDVCWDFGIGQRFDDRAGLSRPSPSDFDVAEDAIDAILQVFPDDIATLFLRGLVRKLSKNLRGAEEDFRRVVEASTHDRPLLAAVKEADGDLVTAGQSLLRNMGNKGFKANRDALAKALDEMKAGELLTPNIVDAAAKKIAKGDGRPFYSLTSKYAKVMEESLE